MELMRPLSTIAFCQLAPRFLAVHLLFVALSSSILQAQMLLPDERKMLLPKEVEISGQVVDSNGVAIGDVSIEHAASLNPRRVGGLWVARFSSDKEGRFKIKTRSPILVFVKPGHRSIRIPMKTEAKLKITLERAEGNFASCSQASTCDSLGGRLCLPQMNDFRATEAGLDVDYVARSYVTDISKGVRGIRHGRGMNWSSGRPGNKDVWSSVSYEEVVYDTLFPFLTDARGKTPGGKFWRYVGTDGESVSYEDMDATDAKKLDAFLDGMCLWNGKRP
jgi:hypothetical protein